MSVATSSALISPLLAERETRRELMVNGTRVDYWEHAATATTESVRTIVVVHGFRGDHHGLLRVVDQLPQFRIITPDLPGFGSSDAFSSGEHDLDAYAGFLSAFLEELRLGPDTILLGHSFGTLVCARFMKQHPGRIYPLILINPISSPALEGPKGLMTQAAVGYYKAAALLPEKAGRALLSNPAIVRVMSLVMTRSKDPEVRRFVHAQHHAHFSSFASRESLLSAFRASVSGTVLDDVSALTVPTLLIAGSSDEVAPLPGQRELNRALADSELKVHDGVGHLIHYETPALAAAQIAEFLQKHPARPSRQANPGEAHEEEDPS